MHDTLRCVLKKTGKKKRASDKYFKQWSRLRVQVLQEQVRGFAAEMAISQIRKIEYK